MELFFLELEEEEEAKRIWQPGVPHSGVQKLVKLEVMWGLNFLDLSSFLDFDLLVGPGLVS